MTNLEVDRDSKFVLFDLDGKLKSRYTRSIHGENIPEAAITVSEEVFWQTINETDGIWKIENGLVVKEAFALPSITDLKINKFKEINLACENAICELKTDYPDAEVLSWPKQEQEARAYRASASAETPLVDAIAEARGIDKDELVQRIIAKADAFAIYSGQMIGKRQKLEDQIAALGENPTPEQLEAIQWE